VKDELCMFPLLYKFTTVCIKLSPLGTHRRRWKDDIKIRVDLKEIGWQGVRTSSCS